MFTHAQRRWRAICILAFTLIAPAFALADGTDPGAIASALNAEYTGKILIQRRFLSGTKLSYDALGTPLG